MTVDEKTMEAVEQAVERELDVVEMVDTSQSALRKMRSKRIARAAILAYEAAKPVPASGGVEAAEIKRITDWLLERNREHLYADSLLLRRHEGDAEKFLDTAILLSTLAALASSTPAEAEAAFRITKRGGLIEHEPLLPAFDLPDGVYDLYATPPATVPEAGMVDAALRRAADVAYRVCAETRHVSLGNKARDEILALASSALPLEPTDRDRIATIIQNAIAEYCTWDSDEDCVAGTGPASYKAADRILSALSLASAETSTSGETVIEYDDALNNAGWKLHGLLAAHGPVTGAQFNSMKRILREVLLSYLAERRAALSSEAKERP